MMNDLIQKDILSRWRMLAQDSDKEKEQDETHFSLVEDLCQDFVSGKSFEMRSFYE